MRSRTLDHLPGRCPRCWIRLEHCLCAEVPQVPARTEVLVVRHVRESEKSTSTARVAALALKSLRFVDFGDDPARAETELAPLIHGAALLFPAEGGPQARPEEVRQLVVLDGTWRQTRRMLKKLPSLAPLPRLVLPPKPEAPLRLRESPTPEGRSTLEALADALELLEGPQVSDPLHRLHELMVERVFRARGVWELKKASAGG